VKNLPKLGSFKFTGVRNVRNHLIEHPEGGDSGITFGNIGIRSDVGPVVRVVRRTGQLDRWMDAGLKPNALECGGLGAIVAQVSEAHRLPCNLTQTHHPVYVQSSLGVRAVGSSPLRTGAIVLARWRQDRRAANGILSEGSPPGRQAWTNAYGPGLNGLATGAGSSVHANCDHSFCSLASGSFSAKNQRRCPQVVQYRTPPAGAILDRASKRVVVDAVGKVIENF
jgi:hypothetical protein